jgi:hypothetical protein
MGRGKKKIKVNTFSRSIEYNLSSKIWFSVELLYIVSPNLKHTERVLKLTREISEEDLEKCIQKVKCIQLE